MAISYESGGANVWYYLVASGGYNTCATRDASYGGVYNLPENTDINVKIGLGSASAPENDWTSTYSTYFLNDN